MLWQVSRVYYLLASCRLADNGHDLFTDTSMVFSHDRHVRPAMEERDWHSVDMYGERSSTAGDLFTRLVLDARSGGKSKSIAKTMKRHPMLAGHRTASGPMFLHRRWLQTPNIKVQVLTSNLLSMCLLYGDVYQTRRAKLNEGTSVQRAVVVRQSRMGGHTRPVVRNM
jgi:hypothetical protein